MISTMDNKMRRDHDAEQSDENQRLIREAGGMSADDPHDALRADVLGSIAGANPNSEKYLGKIDSLITAHGALSSPTPEPASSWMAGANNGPGTTMRLPAGRMTPPPEAPDLGSRSFSPDSGMGVERMGPARPAGALGRIPEPKMQPAEAPDLEHTPNSLFGKPTLGPDRDTSMEPVPSGTEGIGLLPTRMGQQAKPGLLGRIGKVLTRMGDVAGTAFAPGIMANIPGTMLNKRLESNLELTRMGKRQEIAERQQRIEAAAAQAEYNTPEKRREFVRQNPDLFVGADQFQKNDFIAQGKWPSREPAAPKEGDKKIDEYTNADGKRVVTLERADGSMYDRVGGAVQGKQVGHTSPFEAFAYGDPEEKKAAQDFLTFERRMGAQYQRPTDAEFRYSLYQRDPEGYKAVFGDKAATADFTRAEHTAKLRAFFEKQRDAISKDFMLGDDEKAQQLRDLDEAEQQFKEAAGVGGGDSDTSGGKTVKTTDVLDYARKNGVSSVEAYKHFKDEGYRILPLTPEMVGADRVNVIRPDGTPGTVPRKQLKKAMGKGYKEAPTQ